MAPSHLQGLNIVQPSPPPTPYLSDADLLSLPLPDLNAQLELWTNLNFQSDEPLVHVDRSRLHESKHKHASDDYDRYNDQDEETQVRAGIAETTAHENVVNPTVLPPSGVAHHGHANPPGVGVPAGMQMPLDISSILASFGIDPFLAPAVQQSANQSPSANSIAQLLAMQATTFLPPQLNPQASAPPVQPVQPTPVQPAKQLQTQAQTQRQHQQPQSPPTPAPAPKRARTARASVSSADTPAPESPESDEKQFGTPLNAGEDKRRRNTAASARFRLKKKEREAALERKAKELEVRVGELEKECEALRRENGWLKGLVVGVTGAGAVQQQQQATGVTGAKRTREESEGFGEQSVATA
ncbi:uncharacterized protein C8Q71DRAFT_748060 [Rhodofomes roseus]|uniref:BZIP domain-containing protein n=1 Tax=Rhodofomes roseus TaxID=34475 RepID=A0A4Y9Y6F1_9APHY|nr:uncharacterized protein C8Q71DRAFT_748060 [Rhodofomes roseus]KAH9839134.1 hypothetical protein C8Q71DRAFT_748060 [Rhodofomes roseus]TFY58094.1 hypothetical protein EVJ58_g6629 [Rhodofomes roseus]